MTKNLYIPIMETESLFEPVCSQAIAAFTQPLHKAVAGDIVGAEIQIFCDEHNDNLQVLPLNTYIRKTSTGYCRNNWTALSTEDPQRDYLASSLMNLISAIGPIILRPDLAFAIEMVSPEGHEGETFSLGLFQGGAYLLCNTSQENFEAYSWEHAYPTQDMIDKTVKLLSPEVSSSHSRLAILRDIPKVQDALVELCPFKWNDIDPLVLSLDPSLSPAKK
jgi:hypothetical protein